MKKIHIPIIMATALCWTGSASALSSHPLLLNAGINLFGFEFDLGTKLTDKIGLRVGATTNKIFDIQAPSAGNNISNTLFDNLCTYSCDEVFGNTNINIDMQTYNFYLDYYPFGGSFRVTGGLLYGPNKNMTITSFPEYGDTGDDWYEDGYGHRTLISIGDSLFSAGEVDTVTTDLKFGEYTPYIGIGWAGGFNSNSLIGVFVNLGVFFPIDPEVNFTATGSASGLALAAEREKAELKTLFKDVLIPIPHATIGLSLRL